MTATYLGGFSVGESVSGAAQVLEQVGGALEGLRIAVQAELGRLGNIASGLQAQIDALFSAKAAIRIPAVADLEVQMQAAADMVAGFKIQLLDPLAYINGLVTGIAQVAANIQALIPPDKAITGQLAAAAALEVEFGLKIEAIDVKLALLDAIRAALSGVVTVALNVQAALTAAVAGVASALTAYLTLAAKLDGAAGAHCLAFTGQLGDLSTDLDAELPSTGIASGTSVRAFAVVVEASDASTIEGFEAVFRLS